MELRITIDITNTSRVPIQHYQSSRSATNYHEVYDALVSELYYLVTGWSLAK